MANIDFDRINLFLENENIFCEKRKCYMQCKAIFFILRISQILRSLKYDFYINIITCFGSFWINADCFSFLFFFLNQFLYESNTSIKTEMDQLKDQIASQNKTISNSSLQITGNIFIIDY